MLYYATRISENISRRDPEGYLICRSVPIARTGTQEYEPAELNLPGTDLIPVERPEDEVFSVATIASFEGMPVTDDHPSEGVDSSNIGYLQKGHVQNVRRGTGDQANMLLADLIITDPFTIQKVQDGKREISCGYNYEMAEQDGRYIQRAIRGNHVAIVDRGRAGHRVAIQDSAPKKERRTKVMNKKVNLMSRMFASFAKDEDVDKEDITAAAADMQEIAATAAPVTPAPTPAQTEQASAVSKPGPVEGTTTVDEAPVPPAPAAPAQPDKLDKVIALLQQLLAAKGTDEAPAEQDPLDKLAKDLETASPETPTAPADPAAAKDEDDPSDPESKFVDPEQMNQQDEDPASDPAKACDAATLRAAVDAIRPVIAMLPADKRRAASDAAVRKLRMASGLDASPRKNAYLDVMQASRRKANDAATDELSALGAKIMAARNVNYKK